jgi:PHD/YefM family antitoxin component YafN of YafNO toxin-antitoxin module
MTPPKQFLTNEKGERVAVVISIQEYEELLEELEDAEVIRARRGQSLGRGRSSFR